MANDALLKHEYIEKFRLLEGQVLFMAVNDKGFNSNHIICMTPILKKHFFHTEENFRSPWERWSHRSSNHKSL